MDKIYHPVSGEAGYFATEMEKELIDVAILLLPSQCVSSCSSEECDVND